MAECLDHVNIPVRPRPPRANYGLRPNRPIPSVRPILPRSLQRPRASTEGRATENLNEIGVRLWTLCCQLVARFLREGQLAASINHPNCVYIFGSEEIAGIPTITMELVPGGTLKDRVRDQGALCDGKLRQSVFATTQS